MTTTSPPTPSRSRLGHAYGEQLARNAPKGHPAAAALESATLKLAYQDRFLNGPAFLRESELRTLVETSTPSTGCCARCRNAGSTEASPRWPRRSASTPCNRR